MSKHIKSDKQSNISINKSGIHKKIKSKFKIDNKSLRNSKLHKLNSKQVPKKRRLTGGIDRLKISAEFNESIFNEFRPPDKIGPSESPFILVRNIPMEGPTLYDESSEDTKPGYRWLADYEDCDGRRIRIFYNRKAFYQPNLVFHFLPTIDALIYYELLDGVLKSPCFTHMFFKVSLVEVSFDFHGYQIPFVRKSTWASAHNFCYAYGGKGNTKITDDPKKATKPYTFYQGNRGNKLTRVYRKKECGRTFPRCELEIGRVPLRAHGIDVPEDLKKGFDWIFKYIRWVQFDLERFEKIHGSKPWLKRALKKYDLKYVHHLLKLEMGVIPNFGRYLKNLPLITRLAKLRLKRFQERFNGF